MERRNPVDAGGGGGPRGGALTGDQPTARAVWIRLIVFVVILAGAGTVAGIVGLPDVERLRTGIASAGSATPSNGSPEPGSPASMRCCAAAACSR